MVEQIVVALVDRPEDVEISEIKGNLESIRAVTLSEKVDINAYSMGGVVTRIYLDGLDPTVRGVRRRCC